MKQFINYFILFLPIILFCQCDNPVDTKKEKIEKLRELQISESSGSGLSIMNNYLYFKTSNNNGVMYKVNKSDFHVAGTMPGGSTVGIPIISDGIIYNSSHYTLCAYSDNDLSLVWKKTDFTWIPAYNTDETSIYVTDMNSVWALDKKSSGMLWKIPVFGQNVGLPFIENERLYVGTGFRFQEDGYLYCINKRSGEIIFQNTIPYIEENDQFGGVEGGVEIWNDNLYVPSVNRYLYCYDKLTGELKWEFLADAPLQCTPKVSEGTIYFGSLNRTFYALNAETGELKWTNHDLGSVQEAPLFYENMVMFVTIGALGIFDKYSGSKLYTLSSSTTGYAFLNAVWDTDGIIYATAGNEEIPYKSFLIAYKLNN